MLISILPIAGLMLIFLFPFFWIRCAGVALLLTGTAWWATRGTIQRQGILFSVFILAYVISPYWSLPLPGVILPQWLTAFMLTIVAFFWSWYHTYKKFSANHNSSTSKIEASTVGVAAGYALLHNFSPPLFSVKISGIMETAGWVSLFVFWSLIQQNALFADIPWRGDEDYHISTSIHVLQTSINIVKMAMDQNTFFDFPLAGMAFFIITFSLRYLFQKHFIFSGNVTNIMDTAETKTDANFRNTQWIMGLLNFFVSWGWIAAVAAVWCIKGYDLFPGWQYRLLRYPFAVIWPTILPAWDIGNRVIVEPWWLRITPFVCFVGTAGLVFTWWFRKTGEWLSSFLGGCAVLTMPLVLYYGSMYVIEPFIFPLAMTVFLYPEFLSSTTVSAVRHDSRNTALCILLLLKETAVPILGVVGLMRLGSLLSSCTCTGSLNIFSHRKGNPVQYRAMIQRVLSEIGYMLMLILAAFPYIRFRLSSGMRPYSPNFSNLLKFHNWTGYAVGLWEQTGLVIVIAAAGAVILIVKKRFTTFFPHFFLILIYALFFTIDGYPGYGRFNFLLLPGVVALFLNALFYLRASTVFKHAVPLLLVCVIGINIFLSPLNWRSGLTEPLWERRPDFENDTTYYPVSATISWLKEHYPESNIVFYVHDYRFIALEWAASRVKLNYMAVQGNQMGIRDAYNNEPAVIKDLLEEADKRKIPVLVYMCLNGPDIPEIEELAMSGYRLEKLITDPFRAMAVFTPQYSKSEEDGLK